MFDLAGAIYTIISTDWDDDLSRVYKARVEPVESDTVNVRILTRQLQKQSGLSFDANSNVMIQISVKHDSDYAERLDFLVNKVMLKLLTAPSFYSNFGMKVDFNIQYSFDSEGESNFATAAIRFNVSYRDCVTEPVYPNLSTIVGGIDVYRNDGVIDAHI